MAAASVIGVDLGGTKLLAGMVDEDLSVTRRIQRPVAGIDQAALLDELVAAVGEARAETGAEAVSVGIGIPALIDRATGVVRTCVHLPLEGLAFAAVASERLGLPVAVDNDANLHALAEARAGAARGARVAVVLTVGTGIGGGVVVDGAVQRGASGAGAELGHMVVDRDGPRCTCGSRGCLEALASGPALAAAALEAVPAFPGSALARVVEEDRPITGALVTELAWDGDPGAIDAVTRMGRALGVGIGSLVNIFDPDVVVVGGGVIALGELLLGPAREEAATRALWPERIRIEPAAFGPEAGMLGAALLAREEAVR